MHQTFPSLSLKCVHMSVNPLVKLILLLLKAKYVDSRIGECASPLLLSKVRRNRFEGLWGIFNRFHGNLILLPLLVCVFLFFKTGYYDSFDCSFLLQIKTQQQDCFFFTSFELGCAIWESSSSIKANQMLSKCGDLVLCYVRTHTSLVEQCWVRRGERLPLLGARSNRNLSASSYVYQVILLQNDSGCRPVAVEYGKVCRGSCMGFLSQ